MNHKSRIEQIEKKVGAADETRTPGYKGKPAVVILYQYDMEL
jgi:hypothetical protein